MLKVWQTLSSISQYNARGKLSAQPETTHTHKYQHVHVQTHNEDMHMLTHSSEKHKGTIRIQYVHYIAYICIQTCVNGAIGKVRPTLTVLCCSGPCRHVFKQVFFPRSLTYAG